MNENVLSSKSTAITNNDIKLAEIGRIMDDNNGMKNDIPPPPNYLPPSDICEQFQRRYLKTNSRSKVSF